MKNKTDNNISILHLDSEASWRGGQQQASYLHSGLIRNGINSYFLCKKGSELSKYFENHKIQYATLPFSSEFDLASSFKIASFARQHNIDVIHCHDSHSHSLGLISKFFYQKPALISTRRVLFNIQKNYLSKKKYSSDKLDRIVCVSNAIKNVMICDGIDESKLTVINDGIDLSKFNNSSSEKLIAEYKIISNSTVIGTIAAFTKEKDYPNLLSAAKMVIASSPRCVFIALGDGDDLEKMQGLAVQYGISENFIFTGFKSNVGDYLKLFDIFVLNSKSEGLGSSILDAMAVGLPIVATNVGGIPEIVEDKFNGLLVESENPESLAKAINNLVNDKYYRQQLGENSLIKVLDFDIDIIVNKYIDLYNSLQKQNLICDNYLNK